MPPRSTWTVHTILSMLVLAVVSIACAGKEVEIREFGPMANSRDMRRISVDKVAAMMKEIGYQNVALSCQPDQFDAMVKTYRVAGLNIGAVYIGWSTDGEKWSCNIPIDSVFRQFRNSGVIVMIHTSVGKGKIVSDKRIVEQLLEFAKAAKAAGVKIAIYPHVGNRLATLEHAVKIADAVDHPSLGVCFNLCHFLKQNDAKDLPDKLRAAKDRIKLVTINGAAVGNTRSMGWDKLIQQLNQGEFDLPKLLDLICGDLKFDGPIYVQCYNLKAPAKTILQQTYDRWQDLKKHCE